jgi:hypothetical protein
MDNVVMKGKKLQNKSVLLRERKIFGTHTLWTYTVTNMEKYTIKKNEAKQR